MRHRQLTPQLNFRIVMSAKITPRPIGRARTFRFMIGPQFMSITAQCTYVVATIKPEVPNVKAWWRALGSAGEATNRNDRALIRPRLIFSPVNRFLVLLHKQNSAIKNTIAAFIATHKLNRCWICYIVRLIAYVIAKINETCLF